jgi:hypothetical protein
MLGQSKNPATELPTGTSKTASTTDSRFPVLASKNGIHWGPNAKPPTNLKFLQDRANRSRANWSRVNWCQDAESPTQVEYKDYVFNLDYAENEGAVVAAASKLLKTYLPVATTGYRRGINLPFKDFPKGVGFNNELSPAQPDLFEGFAIQKFNAFPVSGQLAAAIPYSTKNSITLPHFAGEWEGPGKDLDLAQIQAAYDGASIVYARNEARLFLGSPDPIGSAHVITFTSNGTSINTFANYSLERRDGQIEYHQYPMTSTFITANHEDFTEGRRQLRNLQDYAKETSEKLRDELNEKWLALGLLDTGDHDEDGFNLNDAPQPVTSNRRLKLQYNFGIGILVMSVMCCIVAVLFRTLS